MPSAGVESQRRELLRFLKGTPSENASAESAARRIGVPVGEIHALVAELEGEEVLRRDGDRLIVVEPAASHAPQDRHIP